MPKIIQVALTFFIVLIAWVFFRADTLLDAWRYLTSMFGGSGTAAQNGGGAIAEGLIYAPYYLMNFIIAALAIWALPTTWDFTRRLSWWKILWAIVVFALALISLTTQSYNPFIYFIF